MQPIEEDDMSVQNSQEISDVKVMLVKGVDGEGIESIEKTGTSGLVDTYTITYTDGAKTTFTVTNGKGISSIEKTSTTGTVDTYTITYNDGTTNTFEVTNGTVASAIAYDNTESGLTGDTVQEVVDELSESYPADKVMMSNGASVEANLASAVMRVKTGTTLATLSTALLALSDEQKSRATVCVNGIYWMRRGLAAVFASSTYIGSSGIYQMQLQIGSTPHFYDVSHNYGTTTHTSTETAVTSWTLYYQGTPIS
jgi:hypothetical protein